MARLTTLLCHHLDLGQRFTHLWQSVHEEHQLGRSVGRKNSNALAVLQAIGPKPR